MDDTSIPELSPEAVKKAKQHAADQRFRAKNRQRLLAQERETRAALKAKFTTLPPEEQERIRERQRAANRRSYAKHRAKRIRLAGLWHKNNPEKTKNYQRRHHEKDPERSHARMRAAASRRRARKANAPIDDFTPKQWEALCAVVKYRCCYCGKKFPADKLTPDHLTPYEKQGSNTLHNVLPCCGSCNSRKGPRGVLMPVQPFLLVG